MALAFAFERRMILRPEPPSSPCTGWTRSAGEGKCCSNSFLRTSMNLVSKSFAWVEAQESPFSMIEDSLGLNRHYCRLMFFGVNRLASSPSFIGGAPWTTVIIQRCHPGPESAEMQNLGSKNIG